VAHSREHEMTLQAGLPVTTEGVHAPRGTAGLGWMSWLAIAIAVALLTFLIVNHFSAGAHEDSHGAAHAEPPPLWACGPFVALLLSIAILPLVPATMHWWESNRNRLIVALLCGSLALLYYLLVSGLGEVVTKLDHAVLGEYVPFIILLFSLYVISGGISLRGDLAARPGTNTAFLAAGGLMASFVGTTGAAMLLIRPLLQTNSQRRKVTHTVIFFIFIVCNCGGCLLPIGDPPLFLGYLRGVPFLWTFRLVGPWAFTCGALLVIYYLWERWAYGREAAADIARDETEREPLRMRGAVNLLWLLGVVLCVALVDPEKELRLIGVKPFPFLRELLMLGLVALSLKTTPGGVREANKFNYSAIFEVAALFIGIFIAMQIPIDILRIKGSELGLKQPWHFFWATGTLSSFLDNAPTYVVFFQTAESITEAAGHHAATPGVLGLVGGGALYENLLVAVSLGAVFMGANTYIGNGPNFMVKSIAEQSGIRMPSFFGYMLYSTLILIPLFVLVTLIFVR